MKLDTAMLRTGKTLSFLIVLLIRKISNGHSVLSYSHERIKYQKRDPEKKWTRRHISVLNREYELMLDLRKFCKKSVSSMISSAIDDYLNDIIDELSAESEDTSDNYIGSNYIIIKDSDNYSVCWRIYWGYPLKLELNEL